MDDITKMQGYPIGQMSKATGVNIETIRYYEKIGVMPKPDRTAGGNRQYTRDQLKRLFFIRRSRGLGFSLENIRGLLVLSDGKDFSCAQVFELTNAHLESVREKIENLEKMEEMLAAMAKECGTGDVPDCHILETLFDESADF